MEHETLPAVETKPDPKRPYKAYAATALTFITGVVIAWITDTDPFTGKELGEAVVQSAIASGIVGGVTYSVPNPKVVGS